MEVGGDSGTAKAEHGGAGVSTNRQGGVGSTEAGCGIEAGYPRLGVKLFSSYGRKFKDEETGVAGIGVKAGWKQIIWGLHDKIC